MGLSEQGRQRIKDLGTLKDLGSLKLRSTDRPQSTAIRNRLEALNSRLAHCQGTLATRIDNHQAQTIAAPGRMEYYNQVLERLIRFENKLQSVA